MVVIGIIAILIALLLPMLKNARESAHTVQCLGQLQQIGYAIHMYANANGGKTPYYSGRHEYPNDVQHAPDPNWFGPGWPMLIAPYLGQKADGKVWSCPSFPDEARRQNYFIASRWMRFQQPLLRSMPMSRIKNSTTYIFAGECTAPDYYPPPWGGDNVSPFDDIDKDDGAIECLRFNANVAGGRNMHPSGNNVLFADNHAASFKKFDPAYLTYSPDEQKSWDELDPNNRP